MTPKDFTAKINEWGRGTMIASHGTRFPAEAEVIHRGRTTLVVDVQVFDGERRLVARLLATQLAPGAASGRA